MTAARDALVAMASSYIGETEPSARLGQLVDPAGSGAHQAQIERLSLCMLFLLGLLEIVFAIPGEAVPYVPGTVAPLLRRVLGGLPQALGGACRAATPERPPQVGDALWFGPSGPHEEHVDAVLVGIVTGVGELLATVVASGQRWTQKEADEGLCDASQVGHECVKQLTRTIRWLGSAWVDVETGRHLVAVVDADDLAAMYPLAGGES